MKQILEALTGFVLLIAGVVMLLQNVVINSFTFFYRINTVNVGGILIVLMMIAFIALIVKPHILTGIILGLLAVTFFVCMIISLNIRLTTMSGLELGLILGSICVGIALLIRSLLMPAKNN